MNEADWAVVPYPSGTRGDLYISLFEMEKLFGSIEYSGRNDV